MDKQQIYIVIPAFNEGKVIKSTIQDLQKFGYNNIVIIDDGSTDNTRKQAQETGADVLTHIINRGQGASLSTGIEYVKENYNPKVIITFDADGQHNPAEIERLAKPIFNDVADIVLGSRFLNKKTKLPFTRKIVLKAGILFTNIISSINLTDTHNGFRALGPRAIEKIKITHRGMEHASDIINEITKNNLRHQEAPVTILYTDYSMNKGQSSGNFIKIGIKVILHKILN